MNKFLVTVCALGLLLSFASAEEASVRDEALAKRNATRFVPSGIKRTLWFLYVLNPDCSPMEGSIEVRTPKEPEHGAVEIVPSEGFPVFPRDNVRFKCNERKIRGVNVDYQSSAGYVGPDEFDLLVLWPTGFAWEMHFNVLVR
jgi:hypothetical protein